ncbi:C1 family peptidase, partial [Candidatus Sumerlaeota bacterium]|nr:C1 family peptidase [Candidatus Sumerlaeota bacterium]
MSVDARWNSGYKPATFDGRDYPFVPQVLGFDPVPSSRNDWMPSPFGIRNQLDGDSDVHCCVSCAITTCIEILDNEEIEDETQRLSVLHHYYHARKSKRDLGSVMIRKGLNVASSKGICPFEYHPYPISIENAMRKPTLEANRAAKNNRIIYDAAMGSYCYRNILYVRDINNWRSALRAKRPIVFGFWLTRCYCEINTNDPIHGSVASIPSNGTGHAVLAVGYDDAAKQIIVQDSRGAGFADEGYWYLPYSVIQFPGLIDQAWIIDMSLSPLSRQKIDFLRWFFLPPESQFFNV